MAQTHGAGQSDLGFNPGSRAWIVHTTTATMAAHNQRDCQPNPRPRMRTVVRESSFSGTTSVSGKKHPPLEFPLDLSDSRAQPRVSADHGG